MGYLTEFTPKHKKALQLIQDNQLNLKQIARQSGLSHSYLRRLSIGSPDTGNIGQTFQAELKKIRSVIEERTTQKVAILKEIIINKLTKWAEETNLPKTFNKVKHKQHVDTYKAINFAPSVSTSFTWQRGMTMKELEYEFNKLASLAASLDKKRVFKPKEGRSRVLSSSFGAGDKDPEVSKTSRLRPSSEAEDLPSGEAEY